jgi:hypothetical protein
LPDEGSEEEQAAVGELDDVGGENAKLIDWHGLVAEAKRRRAKAELNNQKPGIIEDAFYSFVIKLYAQNEQALANAVRSEAERRSAVLDSRSESKAYKRKALVNKVLGGDFDA